MNPFHNRPAEWDLYSPLIGQTMLELGNKKNVDRTYKRHFESVGLKHTSVDWNAQDGALKLDLRKPLALGTFDMVTNIGTSEHVSDQAGVWRNICEAMHIGSVLVSTTPLPGDWCWHGSHYPEECFYRALAALNGLEIERLYVSGDAPRRMWFARMRRIEAAPFQMPAEGIYLNRVRRHA